MYLLRQYFSLSVDDIRRWDVRIALVILLSIPIFLFYKFFLPDSDLFFFIKLHLYTNSQRFAYYLFSKFTLAVLLSIWLISSRRWWWFLISWPLFWYINDFFYIFLLGLGLVKKSVLGFNFYAFIFFPLLYFLRKNYQRAYQKANPTESTYKKRNPLLDTLAIWLLCFSVPLISIYLFFDPALKLDFRFSSLIQGRSMFYFVYHFFDKIVAVALLLVWFFESRRWWYFVIGWPTLLHIFQCIHVFRHYLDIDLIDPKMWYVGSFFLMIIYPIYKIRGYLSWDIFHGGFSKNQGFWMKFTYLLNSMGEYFIVCAALVLINLFVASDMLYPLNVLTLIFLTIWFLFCRQWWYFLIAFPLIWYVLKVTSVEINEAFVILVISLISLYPIYRMRRYVYKEALKNPEEKRFEEEKTNKFSRCFLKETE